MVVDGEWQALENGKRWRIEVNRPEKGQLVALAVVGVASGFAGGSSGRQPVAIGGLEAT